MRSKIVIGKNGKRLGTRIPRTIVDFRLDFHKFFREKDMGYSTPCWIWGLKKEASTYATTRLNGIPIPSNRLSWILHNGEIPNGLWVLHKCDVRQCVNPNHLFLGTRLDNLMDMYKKGRNGHKSGEENHFSKLTESQVLEIRKMANVTQKTYSDIGSVFNVSGSCINSIVSGRSWKGCGGLKRRSRLSNKLKPDDFYLIKKEYASGKTQKEIAQLFKINQSEISRVVNDKRIPHQSK